MCLPAHLCTHLCICLSERRLCSVRLNKATKRQTDRQSSFQSVVTLSFQSIIPSNKSLRNKERMEEAGRSYGASREAYDDTSTGTASFQRYYLLLIIGCQTIFKNGSTNTKLKPLARRDSFSAPTRRPRAEEARLASQTNGAGTGHRRLRVRRARQRRQRVHWLSSLRGFRWLNSFASVVVAALIVSPSWRIGGAEGDLSSLDFEFELEVEFNSTWDRRELAGAKDR